MKKIKKYKAQIYWCIIVLSLGYSIFANDLNYALAGFLFGGIAMEIVSRVTYFLIKNKSDDEKTTEQEIVEENPSQNDENVTENSESSSPELINEEEIVEEKAEEGEDNTDGDIDMNIYVKKNKRAFDEGDTYLSAASGAIVGYELFIPVLFLSIILQALFILPQFLFNLYKKEEYKLLISISSFILLSFLYFLCLNTIQFHIYARLGFSCVLVFLALYSIFRIKNVENPKYKAIPFGPSLFFTTLIIVFFGKYIIPFFKSMIG